MKIISKTDEIIARYEKLGLVKEISRAELQAAYSRSCNHKAEPEVLPNCPKCEVNDVKHHVKRESNGVMGPGYSSWITEEYYICNKCGIHFSKVK